MMPKRKSDLDTAAEVIAERIAARPPNEELVPLCRELARIAVAKARVQTGDYMADMDEEQADDDA